ncbi:acyltransferase ChoActase/COT/CPT [Umbelopsis sp. AD052]|nr:acyltransferase ChoActase/COT/CPT [Umbelopsis sp. AD052]
MASAPTFSLQSTLPRLPVPSLEASCARYLHSLRPLLTETEFQESERRVQSFLASPLSRQLQERLIDLDRSTPSNWLDDGFWLQKAYHEWREPVLVNSNWFMMGMDDPHHPKVLLANNAKRPSGHYTYFQVRRAAHLIYEGVDFKELIDSQKLPIDMLRGGKAQCMHQYTRIFGVTRIPQPKCDTFSNVNESATHIIILVRNQMYPLHVYKQRNGQRVRASKEEIESDLLAIVNDVQTKPLQAPIPILTGAHRDHWAKTRNHLLCVSAVNRNSLTVVEDGLFALSLDDHGVGNDSADWVRNLFTGQGTGSNRWFDKSLNFVVESNGKCALLGEHSPCDALTASYVFDHMLKKPCPPNASTENIQPMKSPVPVERLLFELDETVHQHLQEARDDVAKTIALSDSRVLIWDQYGTTWVKKHAKVSPDAFFQMSLQLAYYKIHKKVNATYETASTRQFLHGRTETIRTCSVDTKKLMEAWQNDQVDSKTKYQLLQTACKSHTAYTVAASNGQGCDRHLLALRLLNAAEPNTELHPIFTDPAYAESQNWRLSTSGLHAGIRLMGTGFGAIVPDGYGVNYMAAPTLVKYGIECKHVKETVSSLEFSNALSEALTELRQVCEDVNGKEQPSAKM